MLRAEKTLFSCVLDKDPYLTAQVFVWLNCLLDVQRVPPQNIFVHYTSIVSDDFAEWLESRRVHLIEVAPYDPRSPHCNKLRQLATFVAMPFSHVVLMDCDTAWIGNRPLPLPRGAPVAAKPVDFGMPPEPILSQIFREAGMGEPDWIGLSSPSSGERTDHNNCNGGLYLVSRDIVGRLDAAWRKWADWCLEHRDLFGRFAVHVDQVGFALALRDLGVRAQHLPIEWNYPIHVSDPQLRLPDTTPEIIHFHRQFGPHLTLLKIGLPGPDAAIDRLNRHIERWLAADFVNSMFWDLRYRVAPELGSGVGSRGDALEAKRILLARALRGFERKKVVDVGCGDLEATRSLPLEEYLGLDVAPLAIALSESKRPDWDFEHLTSGRGPFPHGDAVICLDVLIHQKNRADFDRLIAGLATAARERLIVGGYNEPPRFTSPITAYHRPLTDALRETGVFRDIRIVGRYRDCCLVVADR